MTLTTEPALIPEPSITRHDDFLKAGSKVATRNTAAQSHETRVHIRKTRKTKEVGVTEASHHEAHNMDH